jgi:hypothetical protein
LAHGPLLISGFLGTVIGLERAVALDARWAYTAPLLTGLGGLSLVLWNSSAVGPSLITLGSAVAVAVFAVLLRHEPALHTAVISVGAALWLVANGSWLMGYEIPDVLGWWIAFLVLTIAGERLELTRVRPLSTAARGLFVAACSLLLLGLVLRSVARVPGSIVMGTSLFLLAAWLLRHDVARRTVHQSGLTRYTAACLLSGYVWLAAAGVLWSAYPDAIAGPTYDAAVHAILLGFVLPMIFGHAPIIFPAVLGVAIPFRPVFYLHLLLLHVSLLLRVGSDLAAWSAGREWGGLLNAVALVVFFLNTLRVALRGRQAARALPSTP